MSMDITLTPLSIKQMIYFFLVACIAALVYLYSPSSQRDWLVWSVFTLSWLMIGNIFINRLLVIAALTLVNSIVIFIAGKIGPDSYWIAVYLVALVSGGMLLRFYYPQWHFLILVTTLFAVVAGYHPVNASENIQRVLYVVQGFAIITLCNFIFFHHFVENKIVANIVNVIHMLKSLNETIFASLIQQEYANNIYLFENRIHQQKNRFLRSIQRLEKLVNDRKVKLPAEKWQVLLEMIKKMKLLYALMLDYAQLRRRVIQYSTFEICRDELMMVLKEINGIYMQLATAIAWGKLNGIAHELQNKIACLEDNVHHILQVTAREPLVFLLFVSSLKNYQQKLQEYAELQFKYLSANGKS